MYSIELEEAQVRIVMASLMELPAKYVNVVISTLEKQLKEQSFPTPDMAKESTETE